MTKKAFFLYFLLLLTSALSAQEVMTFPVVNAEVAKKFQQKNSVKTEVVQPITLPFYDDFSVISTFPSAERWADSNALVNTDFAKFPPTIGVATLDAIDKTGKLYANAGQYPFSADNLTSLPIRLDSIFDPIPKTLKCSDSVYLSFYYQPQGRGLMPSKKDSLILEFHSPFEFDTIPSAIDTVIIPHWNRIWATPGGLPVDTFAVDERHYFRQVLIPITDTAKYFKNGFQFRFRNIASLANSFVPDWQSNGDQWNIDVVWISALRNVHDTTIADVAFAGSAPSMLSRYQAMPFDQYRDQWINEIKDSLDIHIANLNLQGENISYKYTIQKNSLAPFITYDGGSYKVMPFLSSGYSTYKPFAKPPVVSPFPPGTDEKVIFHIIHTITAEANSIFQTNDTIQFDQIFSNYYAYDNGTAEAGIGINGAAGSYAVKFQLNKADTMRGIQLYLNQVKSSTNQELIDLKVWNDALGNPSAAVKTMSSILPLYSDEVNQLITYWFEEPLAINETTFPSLIFYIGWTQNSLSNLNVGLDRYNDSHTCRFYNVDGTWQMSSPDNYGSLMLRPVIGKINPLGVNPQLAGNHLLLQPNPVSDGNLFITLPETWEKTAGKNVSVKIFTATGSQVSVRQYTNPLNVSDLATGLYIVVVANQLNGTQLTGKLIVR